MFYDIGVSGKKLNRPGLNQVHAIMKQKAATVLLVLTTNRLYRSNYTAMKFVKESLVARKLRCIFVQSGIDTDDVKQWELLLDFRSIIDKMATQYAPNIRAAHISLFLLRMVVTTLPYGYMGEDVPGAPTKRGLPRQIIVVDPELSGWVIKIFHWFVVDRLDRRTDVQVRA